MKKITKALLYPLVHSPVLGTLTSVKTPAAAALTFDDGPDPAWTPRLLELLKRYGARATFFMVGENAERNPGLLARIAADGHAMGNHTYSHCSLPPLPWREQREAIRRCSRILGHGTPGLLRPPYGHQTIQSRLAALCERQRVIAWSAAVGDWRRQPEDLLAQKLREALQPGAVILLHDSIHLSPDVTPGADLEPNRETAFRALETVLAERAGSLQLLTVPELMKCGAPQWSSWFRYSQSVA